MANTLKSLGKRQPIDPVCNLHGRRGCSERTVWELFSFRARLEKGVSESPGSRRPICLDY